MAKSLLGKDAGQQLHYLTGYPASTCYAYASPRGRPPPGWFIVTLLRSEQGKQWEGAIMQDSKATWWRELDRQRRVGAAAIDEMHKELRASGKGCEMPP